MSYIVPSLDLNVSIQSKSERKQRVNYRSRVNTIIYDPNCDLKILLISGKKDMNKWKLPGGGIEGEESGANTAHRETWEEAGVLGKVGNYISSFKNDERKTNTFLYSFMCGEKLDIWPESNRNRRWVSIYEAFYLLIGEDRDMLISYATHLLKDSM
jgi:8-oxo-dGTP pyrophosphatase MutT (NUDIX family)